ncbi:MAG: adenosine kinase [Alphaproteobacteria bacterium]|jgi:sugar/nucleoside kinase (ribokinase family)
MTTARFDVIGLGNAIVDVIARADDGFLAQHGIAKGGMTLIDAHRAKVLEDALADTTIVPGGSAANTIAGIASLGGEGAFIGRVHADWLGEGFAAGTQQIGVHFDTPAATEGAPTARSVILVTPDGQRSMNTYLGASVELDEGDIDAATIGAAKILYVEGYLWDTDRLKGAVRKAIAAAKAAGRLVALTLSDAFCVGRFRAEFIDLIETEIDIVFANEAEITSLYETENFDEAFQNARATGKLFAITRSEKGAVICQGAAVHLIDATPGVTVVDTTGAGDQFAAGFLYGVARGLGLAISGRLGVLAAGEVISHIGPRPIVPLKELAAGLI